MAHKELIAMKGAEGSDKQEVDALFRNGKNKPNVQEVANCPGLEDQAVAADEFAGDQEPHTCKMNSHLGESGA